MQWSLKVHALHLTRGLVSMHSYSVTHILRIIVQCQRKKHLTVVDQSSGWHTRAPNHSHIYLHTEFKAVTLKAKLYIFYITAFDYKLFDVLTWSNTQTVAGRKVSPTEFNNVTASDLEVANSLGLSQSLSWLLVLYRKRELLGMCGQVLGLRCVASYSGGLIIRFSG